MTSLHQLSSCSRRMTQSIPMMCLFAALYVTFPSMRAAAQTISTIKIELYPEGQHTNPAVLLLNGQRYRPSPQVPVPLTSADVPPELKFLSRVISTNSNGSLEEILNLWEPREHSSIRKIASDPAVFESNQKFFRNIAATRLLARVSYGSFEIFFLAHALANGKTFVKEYPALQVNGSLLLTNALQNDPMFMYLSTKFSQTLTENPTSDKHISEMSIPTMNFGAHFLPRLLTIKPD